MPLERVGMIVADREFIGAVWFRYMKDNELRFCFRVQRHHKIRLPDGAELTVEEVLDRPAQSSAGSSKANRTAL